MTDSQLRRPKKTKYNTIPDSVAAELFKNAPVMRYPGDLAGPESASDDFDFEEFQAWLRAIRRGVLPS